MNPLKSYTGTMKSRVPDNDIGEIRESRFATTSWSIVLAAGHGDSMNPDWRWSRCAKRTGFRSMRLHAGWRGQCRRGSGSHSGIFRASAGKGCDCESHSGSWAVSCISADGDEELRGQRARQGSGGETGGGQKILSLDFAAGESRYQIEPSHEVTPETLFERRWVLTLLDQVLDRLRTELSEAGKEPQFEILKEALPGEMTQSDYERRPRPSA